MSWAMQAIGYVAKRSLPYLLAFSVGAVLGSGVLSNKNQYYAHQQISVSDEKGRHYIVDLEKKVLKETTEFEKRDDGLIELLK